MKPYPSYRDSGVEWIGEIPSGWSMTKMKYETTVPVQYGINIGSEFYVDEGTRFIRTTDITADGGLIDEGVYLDPNHVEDTYRTQLNDFLISRSGTLGRAYLHTVEDSMSYGGYLVRFNFCDETRLRFVFYFTKTVNFEDWLSLNTIQSTIGNVNGQKYSNLPFPIPPLSEQKQIVSFLDHKTQKIDELIEKTGHKIGLLKEKRTSLINHCVTKGLNPDVEMKDSGVEWIGEIPSGWSMRKGSTIGLYSKGSGISKDEVKDSGIPCIRYGEIYTIYDRVVFSTKSFISEKSTDNCVRVSKGSVLLTGSGETVEDIGKCVVYMGESDIYIGGDIIIIDLVGEIQPLFMSYLMNSECIRIQKSLLGRGEIIVHIYPKNIREIQYPIPPLPDQNQIVEYLDEQTQKIDSTVGKETQRIELLKEYRQSLISEVVTGKINVREEMVV